MDEHYKAYEEYVMGLRPWDAEVAAYYKAWRESHLSKWEATR